MYLTTDQKPSILNSITLNEGRVELLAGFAHLLHKVMSSSRLIEILSYSCFLFEKPHPSSFIVLAVSCILHVLSECDAP